VPRAGLTPAVVIAEGATVADEVGFDRLTLSAVADRLGVRIPSLYRHVDSLDALRRGIAVLAVGQVADVVGTAAVGRSRGDALRAMGAAYRRYGVDHPGRYAATVRAPDDDDTALNEAAARVLGVIYAVLSGYGLTGADAVDATRAIRAALHGFVTLESGGGFGIPRAVDLSFTRLVDGLDAMLDSWARTAAAGIRRRAGG
jgi:AcrR family transcriptional regulator